MDFVLVVGWCKREEAVIFIEHGSWTHHCEIVGDWRGEIKTAKGLKRSVVCEELGSVVTWGMNIEGKRRPRSSQVELNRVAEESRGQNANASRHVNAKRVSAGYNAFYCSSFEFMEAWLGPGEFNERIGECEEKLMFLKWKVRGGRCCIFV